MDNEILDEIKDFAARKLNEAYGFCGVADGPDTALLNSSDREGKDITIEIKAEDE